MGFRYSDEFLKNISTTYIIARNTSSDFILVGGLGFGGSGSCWRLEDPENDPRRRGYDEAVIVTPVDNILDDFGKNGSLNDLSEFSVINLVRH